MSLLKRAAVVSVLAPLALWSAALANPGGELSWSFQNTTFQTSNPPPALAMRNSQAWPVIGYGNNGGCAISLFPTMSGVSYWANIGNGFYTGSPMRIRAASSPDGRVAFAGGDTATIGYGGRVSSVTGGWTALPANTRAVAFDAAGALYTATNTAISGGGGVPPTAFTGNIVDFAFSSAGEIGVVTDAKRYYQYNPWLTSWSYTDLQSVPLSSPQAFDVAFDSYNRPHVIGADTTTVYAWDFSTITGQWSLTSFPVGGAVNPMPTLAANRLGTVGASWVDFSGNVWYAHKDDTDVWKTASVTPGAYALVTPGIAYDYDDLPVITYVAAAGNYISLAYDPIVVPEPAAGLLLLAAGALAMIRRRR